MLTPLERDRFIADCVELADKLGANATGRSLIASLVPSLLGEMRRRGWVIIRKCDGNHSGPSCSDPECWNRPASGPPKSLDEALNSGDGSYRP